MVAAKGSREFGRHQDTIADPANRAQLPEIDTNGPGTVGYWQFLLAELHVTSNVR